MTTPPKTVPPSQPSQAGGGAGDLAPSPDATADTGASLRGDLSKLMRILPARCDGRGYYLRAPRDPSDWDVDTVRVDCRGCPDCQGAT